MARGLREIGSIWLHYGRRALHSRPAHYFRRALPVLVSGSLVTWLIWKITPQKLLAAFETIDWPWLLMATLVQLVVLFLWDTVSLWWLFSQPGRLLPFRLVLRARTDSIIWSAVNLEIGQGVFSWKLSQLLDRPLSWALGRCALLGLFDFGTLQGLGLATSFLVLSHPLIRQLRWICVASVSSMVLLYFLLKFLPDHWRQWLESKDWANWLSWWTWRRGAMLCVQRLILFLLVIAYAGVGLAICRIPVDVRMVVGVVPFILIAEAIPGTGGLGARETALVYLFNTSGDHSAELLSFGLVWSVVIILGRVAIGLASAYLPRREPTAKPPAREEESLEAVGSGSSRHGS